nr:flagellar basal body-associated FliL family protein [uncultured Cellulosilyticum sp.]
MENKFKLFVIIGFVVLGLAVAGSTFFILTQLKKTPAQVTETTKVEIKKTDLAKIELEEAITSNVYEEGSVQHIARIHVSLGVDQSSKKEYEAFTTLYSENIALIRNEIIQVIREQTYSMMSKADAQTKLGSEIVNRLNKLLDTELIKEVYFKDFFVQ